MDFEPNEKTSMALAQVQEFMDEHIYPNESTYYEQLDAQEDRWQVPPILEELKEKAKKKGL